MKRAMLFKAVLVQLRQKQCGNQQALHLGPYPMLGNVLIKFTVNIRIEDFRYDVVQIFSEF